MIGYVGYYDRAQINQSAREFSRAPLSYGGPAMATPAPENAYVPFGSSFIEEGVAFLILRIIADPAVFDTVFAAYGYPAGTVPQEVD